MFLTVSCRGQHTNELTELKSIIASESYPNIDGVIISQNGNIFRSGHIMYLRRGDFEKANDDIRAFIQRTQPNVKSAKY